MTYRSVEAYGEDLAWRLRVGRRGRRRIVGEVTAHLADLVAEEEAAGHTPQAAARRATERFGAPRELAEEFNRDCALHSARVAAWTLVACVAAAVGAAGLEQGGAPAVPWPSQGVYYAVPALLVQVAAVCAGTAFLLAVIAPWLLGRASRTLATAVRGQAAAVAALVPVAVVGAGNIGRPGSAWAVGAMSALVALAVPVAVFFSARAVRRAGSVTGGAATLDVIADCCEALVSRWTWSLRGYDFVTGVWAAAVERTPRLMSWLEMRRHPWRSAVTVSLGAGIALKMPDLLKGDVDYPAAAIEATAVFVGYCLFSGLLGLRAPKPFDALHVEGLGVGEI